MAVIAFASAKASPGVTTTMVALAMAWPAERALHVVELDPAGGDLAVRFDLPVEPGLVTLAAAGRRELTADTLLAHTQPLFSAGGIGGMVRRVLLAPPPADQSTAALGALHDGLLAMLAGVEADLLVDCGRIDQRSPAQEVAAAADLLVVVSRPVVAEVHHLAGCLRTLRPRAVSLLLVGDQPYSVSEVADVVGAEPLGALADDERAALALTQGGARARRTLRRSQLLRDARAVAEGIADWLGPAAVPVGEAPPPPPSPGPLVPPAPALTLTASVPPWMAEPPAPATRVPAAGMPAAQPGPMFAPPEPPAPPFPPPPPPPARPPRPGRRRTAAPAATPSVGPAPAGPPVVAPPSDPAPASARAPARPDPAWPDPAPAAPVAPAAPSGPVWVGPARSRRAAVPPSRRPAREQAAAPDASAQEFPSDPGFEEAFVRFWESA